MTHYHQLTLRSTSFLVACALLGSVSNASASPSYPPKLQLALEAALGKPLCVPQCVACHVTNLGGVGTLNVFGANLKQYGGMLMLEEPDQVVPKVKAYFDAVRAAAGTGMMPNGDSDGDGFPDDMEIANGDSPSLVFPAGVGQFCPDIKYGCAGGRIAAVPPNRDGVGTLVITLAAIGLVATRRLTRTTRKA